MKRNVRFLSLLFVIIFIMNITITPRINAAELPVKEGKGMIEDQGYLYYKKGTLKDETDTASVTLVKRKAGTKTEQKLASVDSSPIYMRSNYIYYTTNNGVYRVRTDGKNQLQLFKGAAEIIGFYDSYIYFKTAKLSDDEVTHTIYKIGVNGTEREVMLTEIELPYTGNLSYIIAGGMLYGTTPKLVDDDTQSLYSINLKTKEKKQIVTDTRLEDFWTDGESIYFIRKSIDKWTVGSYYVGNNMLCSLNSNGELKTLVETSMFNDNGLFKQIDIQGLYGGNLYYTDIHWNWGGEKESNIDESSLYSIPVQGGKEKLILDLNTIDVEYLKNSGLRYLNMAAVNDTWIVAEIGSEAWDQNPALYYYFKIDGSSFTEMERYPARDYVDIVGKYIFYAESARTKQNIDSYYKHTYKSLKLK